jgi:hypothetical protein
VAGTEGSSNSEIADARLITTAGRHKAPLVGLKPAAAID